MKRSPMPARRARMKSSGKPMKARGATKAKKEARYKSFLSSAAWKRIRREALERAGHRCEQVTGARFFPQYQGIRCPNTDKLTVHHLTYARFGGDELPGDLKTLCADCHNYVSAMEGRRVS